MARTPLFRQLARALSVIRRARAAGVSPVEQHERETEARDVRPSLPGARRPAVAPERRLVIPAERRLVIPGRGFSRDVRQSLSRRTFLGAAAAGATIAGLPGCSEEPAPNPVVEPTIAIVGAGMAGLHCAYRLLTDLGIAATVYEASDRVGGRMYSDRSIFPDGQHCELGGELIDTGHATMLDLADELGIELLDYEEDDPSLERLTAFVGGTKLTSEEILSGFAPIAAKLDDAYAMLADQDFGFVTFDQPNGGNALDAMSIADWFDSIGAEGPVRTLLEIAYNIEYGLETDEQSFLNLLFLISTDTDELRLFGDSDERFHTKDGNDAFVTRLAEALDPAQIELSARLVAIKEQPDGRYLLTFDRDGEAFEATADHVVLTLPFTMLRQVESNLTFSPPKAAAIAELGYGTNSKLMVGFDARPWRDDHGSNGETFSDLSYQATWETSRLQPGASGILTNFTGGAAGAAAGKGTAEERAADFLDDLEEVFPGVKAAHNGKVARFHWPTHRFTNGSYSAYRVGQYTKFAGAEILRHGNVHFAGEHTSLNAQGYMEGAALTGAMAAKEIADDLGLAEKEPQSWANAEVTLATPADRIRIRAGLARKHRRYKTALRRMFRKR